MTQGSEGIALAQKPIGVSRRLSVAVAMFALAAFLVGTAGSSFAKEKKDHKNKNVGLFDTIVVVNNGGGTFDGSIATWSGRFASQYPAFPVDQRPRHPAGCVCAPPVLQSVRSMSI